MDNLKARVSGIALNPEQVKESLAKENVKVSVRFGTSGQLEDMRFSVLVGEHRERWLIRIFPQDSTLTFSGGVTKTFFGHNLWVFDNEFQQLQAIIGIVAKRLSTIEGLSLPESLLAGLHGSVSVERVELTNHFALPDDIYPATAIERIDTMFKVLFPDRRDRDGDTFDKPGTTSIGKSKSTKVCRVYDPSLKFADRPVHISESAWAKLTGTCIDHLRVELIMDTREIRQLKLQTVEAWLDHTKIQDYLATKSQRYGLTVAYTACSDQLRPSDVRKDSKTFVEYARYWFTDGQRGTPPKKTNGSYNRYRRYMAVKGFNINVPFERHRLLAHDLHEVLKPSLRADLTAEVRQDKELFGMWWKDEGSSL